MSVQIDPDLCNGCGQCVNTCPYQAIGWVAGKAALNDRCTACGMCVETCKPRAILLEVYERETPDFKDRKGVWVFAEQRNGQLAKVSLELLGIGQLLAGELDQELSAVLLGNGVCHLAQILGEYGARSIYLAEHRDLHDYRTYPYTRVLCDFLTEHRPNILLIGATSTGRDLAPRVAQRLGLGLTADCTQLSIDPEDGSLLQTRPAFGGNVMATIKTPYSRPQMATVRPGVMEAPCVIREPFQCRIVQKEVTLLPADRVTRFLETVREGKKAVTLSEARVIVAGGRGVGSKEGMKALFSLAEVLGGEVAGTRVVVEEGWLPPEHQVGQTGQTVRPEIYFACGISGAVQHRAGMMGSRYIIAINKDERAPLFEMSDWGIVGDLHEVIPALTKLFTKAL